MTPSSPTGATCHDHLKQQQCGAAAEASLMREIDFWNLMSYDYKKFEKGTSTTDFGDDSLWGRPPKRRWYACSPFAHRSARPCTESECECARPRPS